MSEGTAAAPAASSGAPAGEAAPGSRGHLTLRMRLIIATLSVLVVIGVVIGATAVLVVRSALMGNLDAALQQTVENAQRGPGANRSGPSGSSSVLTGDADVDRWLRVLDQPGQGDRTLVVVTNGQVTVGGVTKAEKGAPAELSKAAALSLIGQTPDGSPHSVDVPDLGNYRVLTFEADGLCVSYGVPQTDVDSAMGTVIAWTATVVVIGLIVAGGIAALVINRQLLPLRRVAATAGQVAHMDLGTGESPLDVRVPQDYVRPGTEVGEVAGAMNSMLSNMDDALRARHQSELQMRRFVADASHELRTPLTTIRGYADLTRPLRPELPEQVRQSLERIDAGAVRMSGLVDDLLLLARLDAGREPMELESVDISALLIEVVQDAHATTRDDHRFRLDLPDEPLEAVANRARIVQVITNLVTNARVHTPDGTTVTVSGEAVGGVTAGRVSAASVTEGRVSVAPEHGALAPRATVDGRLRPLASVAAAGCAGPGPAAGAGGRIRVRVADDGPGIDPAVVDTVFDRFARADANRARGTAAQVQGGSSGLGLAIAKSLVEAMHGTISVASSDAGAVFTIELPAA